MDPRSAPWPPGPSRPWVGEGVSRFSIATGALFILIGVGFLVMPLVGNVLGRPET